MLAACQGDGLIDAVGNDAIRSELQKAHARLAQDRSALKGDEAAPVGVDSPTHFDFNEFVSTTFVEVLSREAERNHSLRQYVGTLQLRLEQARQDPRYAFLFRAQPFDQALASFLRLVFGLAAARRLLRRPQRSPVFDRVPGDIEEASGSAASVGPTAGDRLGRLRETSVAGSGEHGRPTSEKRRSAAHARVDAGYSEAPRHRGNRCKVGRQRGAGGHCSNGTWPRIRRAPSSRAGSRTVARHSRYLLYYPRRRQQPPALSALMDALCL